MKRETQDLPKVCFVIVYFGQWPEWIDYFVRSCECNSQFHWRIFSNCDRSIAIPNNLFVHQLYKEEFEELVSDKIGASYRLSDVKKLCDLKPAYGHLFSDYLKDYAFWGYTDLDLVYGDLAAFVGWNVLEQFDIVTASKRLLVGHFTLIRNSSEPMTAYQQCTDYLYKLSSAKQEFFDEKEFVTLVKSIAAEGGLRLFEKEIQTEDCIIWWSGRSRFLILWWQGKLIDLMVLHSLAYFHFICSKERSYFEISNPNEDMVRFYNRSHLKNTHASRCQ